MHPVETAGQIRFYAAPSVQYIPPPIITAQRLVKIMRSQAPGVWWSAGWPVWAWEKGERGGRERNSQFQTQFRVRQPL